MTGKQKEELRLACERQQRKRDTVAIKKERQAQLELEAAQKRDEEDRTCKEREERDKSHMLEQNRMLSARLLSLIPSSPTPVPAPAPVTYAPPQAPLMPPPQQAPGTGEILT